MADEPEMIRKQMEETRTDLTEKLETLEEEIVETVQDATEKVSETVENVTETVRDSVETVRETVHETIDTVKSTFDLAHQVDQHPWLMFGGAVAVGYVGGRMLSSLEEPRTAEGTCRSEAVDLGYQTSAPAAEYGSRETSPKSQRLGEMVEKFRPEIDELKGLAIGAALSVVRDLLTRSLAEQAQQPVAQVIDNVTTKLGGKPMHGLLPKEESEQRSAQGYATAGAFEG
jgi:ElaB/YqjD/DUF883 family membrane-anchored ribosome-binding protein